MAEIEVVAAVVRQKVVGSFVRYAFGLGPSGRADGIAVRATPLDSAVSDIFATLVR